MDHPGDFFSASIDLDRINNPKLYNQLRAPNFTPSTISLNNVLQFTGKITGRSRSKSSSGINTGISGVASTVNFIDSQLVPPYSFSLVNLQSITEEIAKQTATQVVFKADPGGPFLRESARRGQTGAQFIAPLAFKKSLIMTNNAEGALLFDVAAINSIPVGILDESNPKDVFVTDWGVNFDDRKRFRSYKATSSSPLGNSQGIAIDKNINQPRHTVIETNDISGSVQENAEYLKNRSFINNMSLPLPVSGWNAPNGKLWRANTLITAKSETLFLPDGFTFMIRQVDFEWGKNIQRAVIHITPPNVYTKIPVVEPWFE
jgi:prophage tail gpP-like protein